MTFTTAGQSDLQEPSEQVATLPSIDWPELTAQIAAGDEAAFVRFYDHFFDRLFRYVLVMTRGDEPLSRDLLQRTMLKVVRYAKPFPDEAFVWSWMTQLAKTSFIDVLRSQKRAPQFVPLELVNPASPPRDETDETDILLEQALERAVQLLPADEKELIQSVYFQKRSHKQIAESTRSTPKAVESKLARVRRKLRALLTGMLNDEKGS